MKVKNDGGTRAVQGFGIVNAGETVDVSEEMAAKLAKIPGFHTVTEVEITFVSKDSLACDVCGNEYKSRSSLTRHLKTHKEDD